MDPDAAHEELLEMARLVLATHDDGPVQARYGEALAERVLGLDEWLQRGGFLPAAWNEKMRAAGAPGGRPVRRPGLESGL